MDRFEDVWKGHEVRQESHDDVVVKPCSWQYGGIRSKNLFRDKLGTRRWVARSERGERK